MQILNLILSTLLLLNTYSYEGNEHFDNILNYEIHYGRIDESILQDMKSYDLLILESLNMKASDINQIKDDVNYLIGYMSFVEVGSWDDTLLSKLEDGDFLHEDGKIVYINDNPVSDLTSKHFREVLIEEIGLRIMGRGFDGVFVDTIGHIGSLGVDEALYYSTYNDLLVELKDRYPELLIVQNRGFDALEYIGPGNVDMLVYENFAEGILKHREYDYLKQLLKYKKKYKICALSISYDERLSDGFLREKFGIINLNQIDGDNYTKWIFK